MVFSFSNYGGVIAAIESGDSKVECSGRSEQRRNKTKKSNAK
jgi:hypothetical protein